MRIIKDTGIKDAVKNCFLKACISPGKDVEEAIMKAHMNERGNPAKAILSQILQNNDIAKKESMPCCQDTGMAVVFLDIGFDVHIEGNVIKAVNDGVREAYDEGFFRKSVLTALSRKNTGDNTPAIIHTSPVPGDRIKIICAPKGFGSENMSAIKMLKPADGTDGIINFAIDTAKAAGGSPCPPIVMGIGIGGTFEYAAIMAKRALLRPLGKKNDNDVLSALEGEILEKVNALGTGPMGMGGNTYCLGVNINEFPTHLAGLPVAININCHACRHEETTI